MCRPSGVLLDAQQEVYALRYGVQDEEVESGDQQDAYSANDPPYDPADGGDGTLSHMPDQGTPYETGDDDPQGA